MVQSGGPKGFRADLVGEFVDWNTELLEPAPSFVQCCFAAVLGFVEEGCFVVALVLLVGLVGVGLIVRRGHVWVRHSGVVD